MFQNLLQLMVPLSKYNVLKIKVIFLHFKQEYVNSINSFMDNMRLNTLNSLTHLLNSSDTDELNMIQHSP